ERHVEDRGSSQPSGPPKAVGRSKIEVVRGMMDGVRRPEPPNAVAAAMEPVVAEVLTDQERNHRDSRIGRNREETMTGSQTPRRRRETHSEVRRYDILTPKRIGERSEIGTPIVVAPHHNGENQALKGRNRHHDWQRKREDAGHITPLGIA